VIRLSPKQAKKVASLDVPVEVEEGPLGTIAVKSLDVNAASAWLINMDGEELRA
jgi:hypothetical protein